MNSRTKRILGGVVLALGTVGTAGAVLIRKRKRRAPRGPQQKGRTVWARPGMIVTFRAELMPGREASERTFRVAQLLPSGRVTLDGVAGEHMETEFERAR